MPQVRASQRGKVGSVFYVYLYEAIGSGMIVFALNFIPFEKTNAVHNGMVHLAMAQAFAFAIILFGEVSGGHFNPAITVAMLFVRSKNEVKEGRPLTANLLRAFLMIFSQIIGGFIGAFLSLTMFPLDFSHFLTARWAITTYVPFTVDEARVRGGKELDLNNKWFWRAAYVEILLTFVFVMLYIQIWKKNGANYHLLNALMSGLGLFFTSYIAIGISGGCLNPMIALVQSPFALAYANILDVINADAY